MTTLFSRVAIALSLATLFCLAPLSAATQAVLNNIKGKVEIKELNSTTWVPAKEGMTLNALATISTGFDSSVTIVMDKNNVYVKPLTRMTIDKLVTDQGKISTNCYLRVGSVQASIKSAEGVKQDFRVQSPYSTASVRGTEFDYDGLRLNVREGVVAFIPGRPQRDLQVPPGATPPDVSGDFAGAPDTPADEGKVSFVPAGTNAETDGSGGKPSVSNERESLKTDASVPTSQTGLTGPTATVPQGPQLGSIRLKINIPAQQQVQ